MNHLNAYFAAAIFAIGTLFTTAEAAPSQVAASKATPPRSKASSYDVSPLFQIMMSEIALQRGQLGPAYGTYLSLARESQDPRLAQRATQIAFTARAWERVLESARLWQQLNPSDALAQEAVNVALVETGQLGEVEAFYAQRIAQSSSKALTFDEAQRLLARAPNKAEALVVLDRLAHDMLDLSSVRLSLAQAAITAQNVMRALSEAQAARKIDPSLRSAVLLTAQLQVQARQFDEAQASFSDYLELVKKQGGTERQINEVLFAQANIAELLRRFDEAVSYLKRVSVGEHYLDAQIRIAQLIAKNGNISQARESLRSITINDDAQARRLTSAEALILRQAGQYQQAYEVLSAALEKTPDDPDLLYDFALAAEKTARFDELERALKKFIALRPNDPHGYNALGYTWADNKIRLDEALPLIQKALELAPDDPSIMDSLGWVYFRLGRLDEALVVLQRAYRLLPSAEIAAHLGEVWWVKGEQTRAREVWRAGQEQNRDDEILIETLRRFGIE